MASKWTDPVESSVWLQPPRPASPQHAGLSRDRIVRTAVDVLDAEGLAALSMRKLAARLDSAPMSLYWHVPTKDALLELAVDFVLAEVAYASTSDGDWTDQVRAMMVELRATCLRHPWLPPLFGEFANAGPNGMRLADAMISTLRSAGMPLRRTGMAGSLLANYVIGFTGSEARWMQRLRGSDQDIPELTRRWAERLRESAAPYPNVLAQLEESGGYTTDEQFHYGLDRILVGILDDLPKS